ncbi:MAG TPA: hypothetical protein VGI86_15895, partial [Acidimicrobiia bacterium]
PGRDTGWLLPAAALSVPALLWATRRRARTDPERAAALLWSAWLVAFALVFSVSALNTYYLGALSPPIAALIGVGASAFWAQRHARAVQLGLTAVVAGSIAYAVWLVPSSGTAVPGWLRPAALALGAVAVVAIAVFAARGAPFAGAAMVIGAGAAILLVPFVASATVVTNNLGVFDTPFQPAALTAFNTSFFGEPLQPIATLPTIEKVRNGAPSLLAAQTSVIAAPFIFATGQEALPLGGYDGAAPSPTLDALRRDVARGEFHLALTAPGSTDPRARWIKAHCLPVPPTGPQPALPVDVSFCLPASAKTK